MASAPPVGEAARTWLFAPADDPRKCAKAASAGADQVIWDLEDAVDSARKAAARTSLASLLPDAVRLERPPWVRINPPGGAVGRADVELLRAHAALGRLVVPKADADALAALPAAPPDGRWLLIIESARGLFDLGRGALRPPAGVVARLAFGALDYALDVGIEPSEGEPELLHARSQVVQMSRVLGLAPPVDAPCPVFAEPGPVAAAARRARHMGFAGMLAIHPAQLGPIAAAFAPRPAEVDWARRVLAASAAGAGTASVDGAMVDRPVIERARAILAASDGD